MHKSRIEADAALFSGAIYRLREPCERPSRCKRDDGESIPRASTTHHSSNRDPSVTGVLRRRNFVSMRMQHRHASGAPGSQLSLSDLFTSRLEVRVVFCEPEFFHTCS